MVRYLINQDQFDSLHPSDMSAAKTILAIWISNLIHSWIRLDIKITKTMNVTSSPNFCGHLGYLDIYHYPHMDTFRYLNSQNTEGGEFF
jgi:hypothetical protein